MGFTKGDKFVPCEDMPRVDGYEYEQMPYGTRQYGELFAVYLYKEKIAEVQRRPYSSALHPAGCIVKFDNHLLYSAQGLAIIAAFLDYHEISVQSISRVDICADFNKFETYEVVDLIRDFLSMTLRHVGRGDGGAYFEHRAKVNKRTRINNYYMQYSGLSFGSRQSDVRVYLYNKTKELAEVHDKPYIRDTWEHAGLQNTRKNPVWRLEVSISGKGTKFRNKENEETVTITIDMLRDKEKLATLYYTFVSHYFQFVKNRPDIKNITREPRIDLWGETPPIIDRRILRTISGGNLSERIAIHKLWQMSEEYRKMDNEQDRQRTQRLAEDLAAATDLMEWLKYKRKEWPKKHRKI